jgi:hypothetical protein
MTGCGGGGGGGSSTTITTNSQSYFQEMVGAFSNLGYVYALQTSGVIAGPYRGGIVFATGIKKLPNGKSGIIFSAGASNSDPTQECYGQVYIFEYSNGTFNDVTSTIIDGGNNLHGFPSVTAADDLNGDGVTDFVSAVTQDCGRTTQTNANALTVANPVALISNTATGKYEYVSFAYKDGWENVRIGTDSDGSKFVALGGYGFQTPSDGPHYKYKFSGTTPIQVANDFPTPDAQGFTLLSSTSTGGVDQLIQPGWNNPNAAIEGFYRSSNGVWMSAGAVNSAYPILGYSNYTSWTGGVSYVPVLNINGNAVLGTPNRNYIVTNSCGIKISPTVSPSALMMAPLNIISNYVPGEPISDSMTSTGRMTAGVKWLGANITNNILSQKDPVIVNEQITGNGGAFNQYDCRDINGDGYDDIVGYALWQGDSSTNAFPIIYLNQKDGTFKRSTVGNSASFVTGVNAGQHTSMMMDIDGDGIQDLIIFPGSPNGVTDMTNAIKFFKGLKKIDQ